MICRDLPYLLDISAQVSEVPAGRSKTKSAGMDYHLLVTDKPLDAALSEYLFLRPRGN